VAGAPLGACYWLADGTRARRTEAGWEFLDVRSGEVSICAEAISYGPDVQEQVFWLDHAIAAVRSNVVGGQSDCCVFLYRPGLATPERIGVDLSEHEWPVLFAVSMSGDGKWMLCTRTWNCQPPYELVSLTDGSVRRMPSRRGAGPHRRAFFTPDSELLVMVMSNALNVWNLAKEAWEQEITIDPSIGPQASGWAARTWPTPNCTVSPERPWRVLLVTSRWDAGMYVVNLERRTSLRLPTLVDSATIDAETRRIEGKGLSAPLMIAPPISVRGDWLGNDRLLIQYGYRREFWVINADGTNPREILR
jgi:hypothetical protein